MTWKRTLLFCFLILLGCSHQPSVAEPKGDLPKVRLKPIWKDLRFERPVFVTHAPDGSNRRFVVEQRGTIRVFPDDPDVGGSAMFLDIRDRVRRRHNEEGLLSLAFHPKFEQNGTFFVYYSASNPRRGVLSSFRVRENNPESADENSETVILEVAQPFGNHNGATVLFGPDGYLYISYGDGGAAGDPMNHSQNLGTLLGTICRIDVDRTDPGKKYAIPEDNPFVGRSGARPEIWAYGLRNVWRMSFDRETGDLWAGDVGQNAWEEIDLIRKGGNYGWNVREGTHEYGGKKKESFIDPVVEYSHRFGQSVTGGYVYRGDRLKKLKGAYIYADYVTGRIWALRWKDGKVTAHREILNQPKNIASFGEGPDGELYLCTLRDGRIWVLEETGD